MSEQVAGGEFESRVLPKLRGLRRRMRWYLAAEGLAMLALARGVPVPRSRLTAVLWGDRGEEQARNSLRQALATSARQTTAARLLR